MVIVRVAHTIIDEVPDVRVLPVRADTRVAPVRHRLWGSYNTKHAAMKHSPQNRGSKNLLLTLFYNYDLGIGKCILNVGLSQTTESPSFCAFYFERPSLINNSSNAT